MMEAVYVVTIVNSGEERVLPRNVLEAVVLQAAEDATTEDERVFSVSVRSVA